MVAAAMLVGACKSDGLPSDDVPPDTTTVPGGAESPAPPSGAQPTSPGDESDPGGPDAGPGALPTPVFQALAQRCKLISNRNLDDPTANNTHFRANLRGTDLGIPVAHGNDLYFFFGDTAGVRAIWPLGPESLPDAVGFAPYAAVKKDVSALCNNLRFLAGNPAQSAGRAVDGRIERDFAGAGMAPPPGHSIS